MANLWKQATFPGASLANITTMAPSNPGGGSYAYTHGSTLVADGSGNLYRNSSVSDADTANLVGWVAPSGKKFIATFDLWEVFNRTNNDFEFHFGTDASNFYDLRFLCNVGGLTADVFHFIGGSGTSIQSGVLTTFTPSVTQASSTMNVRVTIDQSIAAHTSIKVETAVNGGAFSTLFTINDPSSIGMAFVHLSAFTDINTGPVRMTNLSIDEPAVTGSLAVGNLGDITVTGAAEATCLCPAPSGGTGTYTFQQYRSTTANFVLGAGNILAGRTSQTYDETDHVAGTRYWIAFRISDGINTVDTFKRMVRLSGLTPLVLGYVGDSTDVVVDGVADATLPGVTPNYGRRLLSAGPLGLRAVTVVNMAVSGTQTANWIGGTGNMNAALSAFGAQKLDACFIRLGANDAQAGIDQGTFSSHYSNIIAALVAGAIWKGSKRVFLDYPTWREPGADFEIPATIFDETYTPAVLSYLPVIDAAVDNAQVFGGDRSFFDYSACKPAAVLHNSLALPGAIHPSSSGTGLAGYADATGLLAVIAPSGGGTTTIVRTRRTTRGRT